jgi:hypothetical protein
VEASVNESANRASEIQRTMMFILEKDKERQML